MSGGALQRANLATEVSPMIANLATEHREALPLTQLLGLPYADEAAVCGCRVGTPIPRRPRP
jgi:DNA-directed RNA polymerase specialized sigma24 family protein